MKNLPSFASTLLLLFALPVAAASNLKGTGGAGASPVAPGVEAGATEVAAPTATVVPADPAAPAGAGAAMAHLVVFRDNEFIGSLVGHRITVNGRRLGNLYVKTFLAVDLPPGEYTICNFGDEGCIEVSLQAGASHYLRDRADGGYSNGAVHSSFWLEEVAADGAPDRYKDYRRMKLHRKFSLP